MRSLGEYPLFPGLPMQVDRERERVARDLLLSHLKRIEQQHPERNADQLLDLGAGMEDRLEYLKPF